MDPKPDELVFESQSQYEAAVERGKALLAPNKAQVQKAIMKALKTQPWNRKQRRALLAQARHKAKK